MFDKVRVNGMGKEIERLIEIVATLRGPNGCPWDREQTYQSLLPNFIEEVYEYLEAVDNKDISNMREELGDTLLQIILHAQIAAENNHFTIEQIASEIGDKLIRRHPHVFGNTQVASSREVIANWEEIKKKEKAHKRKSLVDDIPSQLPALLRAEKVQRRVAKAGFDWPDTQPVLDKVEEEFKEFREAVHKKNIDEATEELGDILFSLVNVARHHGIIAEEALRVTINKFSRRFRFIENHFEKKKKPLEEASLDELDAVWNESKKHVG